MTTQQTTMKDEFSESHEIKQKIVQAASMLFEKKGLYETSVAEIAEEAGISAPVTYHYVKRKSDILLLIMEDFTYKFVGQLPQEMKEPGGDAREKLARAIDFFFRLVDEDAAKVILVYRKSRALDREGRSKIMADETEHVQVFEGIINEGIQQGVFKAMDPNLTAYNILTAGHAWALKGWHFKKRYELAEYIRLQTRCVLDCLAAGS